MASIADNFIQTMARINAINPSNDEPMRYAMRMCKQHAEQILTEALRRAEEIAYLATSIQRDGAEALADATAPKE